MRKFTGAVVGRLAMLVLTAGSVERAAAQTVWTNVSAGAVLTNLWGEADNWSAGVPGSGATAYLTNSINSYGVTVESAPATFTAMALSNAVGQTTTLTVRDDMDFGGTGFNLTASGRGVINVDNGGSTRFLLTVSAVDTSLNIRNGGALQWHNTATRAFYGCPIVVQSGGYARGNGPNNLGLAAGSSIRIEEGALFDYTGGWLMLATDLIGPAAVVINRGTMDMNAAGAALQLGRNSGNLNVSIGLLQEFRMESGIFVRRGTYAADNGILIARSAQNSAQARFTLSGGVVSNAFELSIGTHEGHTATRTCDGELRVYGGEWQQTTDKFVLIGGHVAQKSVAEASQIASTYDSVLGKLTQTSGVFRAQGDIYVGNGAGQGVITLSGGQFYNTNATATGSLMLGTRINATAPLLYVGKGTLNLQGGTMVLDNLVATSMVAGVSHSMIHFDGGTLAVKAADVDGTNALVVGNGTSSATLTLLGGAHTFADGLVINSNATLTGTGAMSVSGDLTLEAGSALAVNLDGTTAGTEYDQLTVDGNVDVTGCTLEITLGFTPVVRQTFEIVKNTSGSAVTGMFANGPTVSALTPDAKVVSFLVNTAGGDGHDIVLSVLPGGTIVSIR